MAISLSTLVRRGFRRTRFAALGISAALVAAGCEGPVGPPAPAPVASVTVAGPTSMEEGKTAQFTATARDAEGNVLTGRSFVWQTSSDAVASVSGDGATITVTAKAAGSATISATSEGRKGDAALNVTRIPIATLVVTPDTATLQVGGTRQLAAVARDASGNALTGRQVTWTSSDTTKAKVSSTGMVTAMGSGSATITASAEGRNATATITVVAGPAIGVSATSVTLTAQTGQSASGTVNVTNAGGGTLSGLSTIVTYPQGAPSGWLTASLNTTTAPATLTLQASAANLPAGTYNATVAIRSSVSGVAERSVAVTFTVTPASSVNILPGTISAGTQHTCGLTVSGAAYCWGSNNNSQLGDGTQIDRLTPTAVAGGLTFQAISAGDAHTCGITTAGAAYCWGANTVGQLGINTSDRKTTPFAVVGGHTFKSISAGASYACGVTTAGQAYCWGFNLQGQLGTGTHNSVSAPTPVAGGLTFETVSTGNNHTVALTPSGAAYAWGLNDSGALGDGTTTLRNTPVAVAGGLTFKSISAGGLGISSAPHTAAITSTGAAYAWGNNGNGQLGDGTTTNRLTPTAVAGGVTFASINAGGRHTVAITPSGAAYAWGQGGFGQLGTGAELNRLTPTVVLGGLTLGSISAGYQHSCGVTTAGAGYCWGENGGIGKIGDGTTVRRHTPTAVAGGLTFKH